MVITVGYMQERRSEESLAALNKPTIVILPGDRILADLHLITSLGLELGELSLTGETRPARKNTESRPSGAPLGQRLCIAFMGTLVRSGTGIVISTGLRTEFGAVFAVSQIFVVDHITHIDPSSSSPSSISHVTPAVRKILEIGEICNNAFRNTEGVNAGQSTHVAMPNVLAEFGVQNEIRVSLILGQPGRVL
ncbi:High affinity Ca2+/Mn2+ P-type ATPase-like protein [Ceratobasidium sp. 394]|nr:High affinity Ca2+/Mn2+ P-type ATPase-like protein [Ceratobasidium sp. 394]